MCPHPPPPESSQVQECRTLIRDGIESSRKRVDKERREKEKLKWLEEAAEQERLEAEAAKGVMNKEMEEADEAKRVLEKAEAELAGLKDRGADSILIQQAERKVTARRKSYDRCC